MEKDGIKISDIDVWEVNEDFEGKIMDKLKEMD
jgi:hypothetical protein